MGFPSEFPIGKNIQHLLVRGIPTPLKNDGVRQLGRMTSYI